MSERAMSDRLIIVDWGTSNFRAFLVDAASGECLDSRRAESGIRALESAEFPHYCRKQVDDWRDNGRVPVYLAGMVGAKRGWHEAPQLELPVDLATLAANVVAAPGLDNAWLVPGVKIVAPHGEQVHDDAGLVDVMRGEEVQIFGALAQAGSANGVCCVPGTHSKWARVEQGRLVHFVTAMTGELYHAVRFHTLPGEPARASAEFDEAAFRLGVARSRGDGGVLHALFEARSRHLYAGLVAEQVGSFISGVLIGEEVRAMRLTHPGLTSLHLIGAEQLQKPYRIALEAVGIGVRYCDSDAATLEGVRALALAHADGRRK